MIRISINNQEGKIDSPLTIDQLAVISNMCSFKVEGSEYKSNNFKKRGADWDGTRRLFNASTQRFPIGLLSKIEKFLVACGIEYTINDMRTDVPSTLSLKCGNIEPRYYQRDATMSAILNGSGIIKSATGSGKTTIATLIMSAFNKPTVFIVHTKDLMEQAIESFTRILGVKIGQIGDGIVDIQDVTVATVQTLSKASSAIEYESYKYDEDGGRIDNTEVTTDNRHKILEWSHKVGLVLFDEVQRVASRTAFSARFMFHNATRAFGLSASPWRDDGCDLMIEAAFGPVICDIPASQLIRDGYLVRPNIYVKKVMSNIWKGKDYSSIYKSYIVENTFRNLQIMHDAIDQYQMGRTTLILVTQVKHGQTLEAMLKANNIPAVFISGKSGMKKRRQVIQDMRDGKVTMVIASTIADVGLDVPRITSIVEAGAGKSSVTALQRVGRAIRPFNDKKEAHYITYRDTAPYLNTQIDKKLMIWRTEPEFNIIEEG